MRAGRRRRPKCLAGRPAWPAQHVPTDTAVFPASHERSSVEAIVVHDASAALLRTNSRAALTSDSGRSAPCLAGNSRLSLQPTRRAQRGKQGRKRDGRACFPCESSSQRHARSQCRCGRRAGARPNAVGGGGDPASAAKAAAARLLSRCIDCTAPAVPTPSICRCLPGCLGRDYERGRLLAGCRVAMPEG